MQEYRKKFIILNLALVGTVLLAVLIAVGAYIYGSFWTELETTMNQVLEPFGNPDFMRMPADENGGAGDGQFPFTFENGGSFNPPAMPENAPDNTAYSRRSIIQNINYDKKITVLAYTQGNISVISSETDLSSEEIALAVSEILTLDENFGKLGDMGLIYSKAGDTGFMRIALASRSYITNPTIKLVLILFAIFAGAMVVFFFVSRYISALAVKPLEKSTEMEKQFVADISHDLKTPLTVILANNSILRENEDSTIAEQKQWIDSTDESAKSMQDMINEMLTLSQMDSPQISVEKSEVNLSDVATKAAIMMESIAYENGVEFTYDNISENINVIANRDYVQRICASLLNNAMKYEPRGGKIEVSLSAHKKKAYLTVANRTAVIPGEDLEHIFERFYRADKSRTGKEGHGLGLSISKRMAELMDGDIEVKSNKECGTEFTLILNCLN